MASDLVPVPSTEIIRARFMAVAAARAAQQNALHDESDPWVRADVQADIWLRSPRFAAKTREQYARIYRVWRAWCQLIAVPPFEVRRSDVDAYALALETVGNPATPAPRPLSRRTIAMHLAGLSSYYGRAVDDGVTDRNPVPAHGRPKVSRESRQPQLTPDQLRALIAAADSDSHRSAALVALLVMACLRVSEALTAQVQDLSYQAGAHRLRVIRKGDHAEQIPLPDPVYARVGPVIRGRRDGLILRTSTGAAWDRKAAWQTIRRLGRRAGITTPIGPHTLRHAYITRGHELGIPVARLQVAAGHSSVDTTRLYDRSHLDRSNHPSFAIAADLVVEPAHTDG